MLLCNMAEGDAILDFFALALPDHFTEVNAFVYIAIYPDRRFLGIP